MGNYVVLHDFYFIFMYLFLILNKANKGGPETIA